MSAAFALDPRLAADTRLVASLPLCDARLMDDSRYGWLVLVPRREGLVELDDMDDADRAALWHEVELASRALRTVVPCDKLNLGALGNIVRQLHVHVVARREGDAGWPGPVWGHGQREPYAEAPLDQRLAALRRAFGTST